MTPQPIQSTYERWAQHADRRAMPQRLSLVTSAEGSWDDFIRLWPNRDLPAFVRDALPAGHGLSDASIARFSAAHHYAAMFGIVTDRIVDDQCDDPSLRDVRKQLLDAWLKELAAATGDEAGARSAVGEALRAWKRGIDLERRLLGRSHGWDEYATAVVYRLRWVSTTAATMLRITGNDAGALALETTYDQFLIALQVMDDYEDRAEDERCRGASFAPGGLGIGPRALAGLLILRSAQCAANGGLSQLSTWLREFAFLLLQPPARMQ